MNVNNLDSNAAKPAEEAASSRSAPSSPDKAAESESLGKDFQTAMDSCQQTGQESVPQAHVNLSDLFGAAAQNIASASVPSSLPSNPVGAAAAPSRLDEMCEALVDRILVAMPSGDSSAEVRVRIDESWLSATEIRIVADGGGAVSVEFESDNLASQRFLLPHLGNLRDRLGEASVQTVTVRMSESGDTGDGRSRNRRNLYEEMGEA